MTEYPKQLDEDGRDQASGDEPLIDALRINHKWRAVWLRAVALSWRNPGFKRRLLEDPRAVFEQELGFDFARRGLLDERVEVIVVDYEDAVELNVKRPGASPSDRVAGISKQLNANPELRFTPGEMDGSRRKNGWRDFGESLQQTLILRLPPAPREEKHDGLAVADYDAAGRVYYFTLC
jgi:hypothetical protein